MPPSHGFFCERKYFDYTLTSVIDITRYKNVQVQKKNTLADFSLAIGLKTFGICDNLPTPTDGDSACPYFSTRPSSRPH